MVGIHKDWWQNHGFIEIRELCPGMVPEDMDEYCCAFIEGAEGSYGRDREKDRRFLERIRNETPDNPNAYAGGPIYWAYRKCYGGAAILLAALTVVFCHGFYYGISLFAFIPTFGSGALFNSFYQGKMIRELKTILSSGVRSKADIMAKMRERGGSNSRAAVIATIAWTIIFVAVIVIELNLFPEHFD